MNDDILKQSTRLSLLERLKGQPNDQESWSEFVSCYEPVIKKWCQRLGLQEADTNDVSQNVLFRIAKYIKRFERGHDGRFRSWLKTVVTNAWRDFIKSRKEQGSGDEAIAGLLQTEVARDELLALIDEEYEQQLLKDAMAMVRQRVKSSNWLAFEKVAIHGLSAESVSTDLGIPVANVYVAKNRIKTMLAEEVSRLDSN